MEKFDRRTDVGLSEGGEERKSLRIKERLER